MFNRDPQKKNEFADAQTEYYRGQIAKQKKKSDTASAEMRSIREGTDSGNREYRDARRDYYRAEANKDSLSRDKRNFESAFGR